MEEQIKGRIKRENVKKIEEKGDERKMRLKKKRGRKKNKMKMIEGIR